MLLSIQASYAQVDTSGKEREVYNKEFKWHIKIPAGFENITDEKYAQLKKAGKDAMQKSTTAQIDSSTRRIFAFRNSKLNSFDSNYQYFDPKVFGDFKSSYKNEFDLMYKTLVTQMPAGAKIDTAISKETISNLTFQTFKAKVVISDRLQLNLQLYVRLFDKNVFTATIVYFDEKNGTLLQNAWKNSKFEQN
jgi:hypothetical protein